MERKLYIVFTAASGIGTQEAARQLPALRCQAQLDTAESLVLPEGERVPDAVVAGCAEASAAGELAANGHCALLLLGERTEVEALAPFCVANGILCAERAQFAMAFPQLLAMTQRLRSLRVREYSLQRKLNDTKLVSRAKLLLMTRLQMSEAEAHRYIEKAAMDSGEGRREIALRLIRTYEE